MLNNHITPLINIIKIEYVANAYFKYVLNLHIIYKSFK